jgi:hypothetical protein
MKEGECQTVQGLHKAQHDRIGGEGRDRPPDNPSASSQSARATRAELTYKPRPSHQEDHHL